MDKDSKICKTNHTISVFYYLFCAVRDISQSARLFLFHKHCLLEYAYWILQHITLCLLGNFLCFFCPADFFSKSTLSKNSFKNTILERLGVQNQSHNSWPIERLTNHTIILQPIAFSFLFIALSFTKPITLRKPKTAWSFCLSECNRVRICNIPYIIYMYCFIIFLIIFLLKAICIIVVFSLMVDIRKFRTKVPAKKV